MATYTCRDCDYFWDKTDFDSGKGRIAYSSPADGIKEGDVVCEDCYNGDDDDAKKEEMTREEDDEEEDKAYVVTDITFDDDEDGIMTEGDWEALKQEVYTTTWFALNEDDLCDQITEKTGWLVAGFECKEIC